MIFLLFFSETMDLSNKKQYSVSFLFYFLVKLTVNKIKFPPQY